MRPVALILALGLFGAACVLAPPPVAPQPLAPREIDVLAWQWGFEPKMIEVQAGQLVKLRLTSLDVEHRLVCEPLALDAVAPKRGAPANRVEFTAPMTGGDFLCRCAGGCGPGQSRMRLRIRVQP